MATVRMTSTGTAHEPLTREQSAAQRVDYNVPTSSSRPEHCTTREGGRRQEMGHAYWTERLVVVKRPRAGTKHSVIWFCAKRVESRSEPHLCTSEFPLDATCRGLPEATPTNSHLWTFPHCLFLIRLYYQGAKDVIAYTRTYHSSALSCRCSPVPRGQPPAAGCKMTRTYAAVPLP